MVATKQHTREEAIAHVSAILDELPVEALAEVVSFVEFQRFKLSQSEAAETGPVPVKLGGLLAGVDITEADIADVRREMWDGIEDRVP